MARDRFTPAFKEIVELGVRITRLSRPLDQCGEIAVKALAR
jgi:hypothetical protein